jgi:hypothetical protein
MSDHCGCGHCSCDDEEVEKSTQEKIIALKKAIADLGYKIEETENGEIKLSE